MASGVERRALVGVLVTTATGVLPAFLVGGLAVQIRADLDFDAAALGAAAGTPFAAAALSSAVLGHTAERIGPGRALRLAAVGSAITMVAIAVLARSWLSLACLLALSGVVNAAAQPSANLYLSRAVAAERLGWALALKQSAIPAGTLLAGLAVPIVGLTVGWRWAFVGGAAMALAAAALLPPEPREVASPDGTGRRAGDVPLRSLALLGAGAMLGAATAGAGSAFLVSGAVASGMGDGAAGLLLTFGSALAIGHRLHAGRRADRAGQGRGTLPTVATMLAVGTVGSCLFALTSEVGYLLGTPLAFGVGWAWPGLFNLAVVRSNPNAPGAATGITQTGTYLGALAGPLAMGTLVEANGYRTAWLVVAATFLAAAATIVVGARRLQTRHPGVASPTRPPASPGPG